MKKDLRKHLSLENWTGFGSVQDVVFFEQKSVPASCIDKIKSVFKAVAKTIVDLDESSTKDTKFLANYIYTGIR